MFQFLLWPAVMSWMFMAIYETSCPMSSLSNHLALSDHGQSDKYKKIFNFGTNIQLLITRKFEYSLICLWHLWFPSVNCCLHIWHIFRGVVVLLLLIYKNSSYVVDIKLWSVTCSNIIISQFIACLLTFFNSIMFQKNLLKYNLCVENYTQHDEHTCVASTSKASPRFQSWSSLKGNYYSHF